MAATGRAPSLALPLDQGGWGTCAAYAFANAVSSGLMGKYDVPIEREEIVGMLKQQPETARVREGIDIKAICVGWNQIMEKPHIWIDDTNKTKSYKFKVTSKICSSTTEFAVDQIENINDAYQQLSIFQAAEIQILTHIIIPDHPDHGGHAVSAFRTYDAFRTNDAAPKMRAMNSWGANQPTLNVTRENFVKCILLNVVITEKQSSSGRLDIVTEELPVTTLAWEEAYLMWHVENGELRNLIMAWAHLEPRMGGSNISYMIYNALGHNLLNSEDIKIIASSAPATLHKLFNLGILGDEKLEKYGSRGIVQLIKRSISDSEDGDDEES
ncbi:hypothetical protein FRACYDRAFT_246453 [Fragilariopsis cylindrus CCMP1102]|uniref:Uncharacterized protein n=1 Tax=Fragilariopsis cylindrus CCMP1102 TaxID=635003 RepID=A0A1E7EXL5_9STRA|nr:hypothetical protein FRACYDRAFT_246453 [Fragilariopsis cylindrus CCMP1102]|eukprot:OEU10701.1 hypothetical protein FRACYDRAFT_246453 [Fragilariopsis cylindrus CCMP1102]